MTMTTPSELLTIGSVLTLLQAEFPEAELSISKIRFLESEGLVRPARTPSGYRKFSSADVDRLRYTLIMQRDHFLPLRVIRDQLTRLEEGADPAEFLRRPTAPDQSAIQAQPQPESDAELEIVIDDQIEVSLKQLAEITDLPVRDLADIERSGWLQRGATGEGFSGSAIEVAKAIKDLRDLGLNERSLGFVKASAEKQVDIVMRLFGTRLASKSEDASEVREQATKISALSMKLETLLVRQQLAAEFDSRQ